MKEKTFEEWNNLRNNLVSTLDDLRSAVSDAKEQIQDITDELCPNIENEFDWFIRNGFVPGAVFHVPKEDSFIYVKSYSCNIYGEGVSVIFVASGNDATKGFKNKLPIKRLKDCVEKNFIVKPDGSPIELKED